MRNLAPDFTAAHRFSIRQYRRNPSTSLNGESSGQVSHFAVQSKSYERHAMNEWLEYFEWNKVNRRHIPWAQASRIVFHLLKPLIRSLQRFQVGESGEGSHLRKQAATTGCPIYQKCIDLFIKEEQEHAR